LAALVAHTQRGSHSLTPKGAISCEMAVCVLCGTRKIITRNGNAFFAFNVA